jgi:exosortase
MADSVTAFRLEMSRATPRQHVVYAIVVAASVVACFKGLAALVVYAWNHDSSSHILLIPFLSLYLTWLARKRVFAATCFSVVPGTAAILIGAISYWIVTSGRLHLSANEPLSLSALSLVVIWAGAFLLCYGYEALRAGAYPLMFLLLMVPLPDPVLDWMIRGLQQGSTEVAYRIFEALGIPVLRQGFLLSVPGVTIEVAQECSSIRSSMALLITCLVAAHLYLRTWWKVVVFVLLSLPLSVVKNGVRIATLTLLSLYVNPGFLRGNLHRDGGFVFFLLALLMLWPVFTVLEKSDRASTGSRNAAPGQAEAFDQG